MRPAVEHLPLPARSKGKSKLWSVAALSVLTLIATLGLGCGAVSPGNPAARAQIELTVPSQTSEVGLPYDAVANVRGGTAPYLFALASGNLPPGTVLNNRTGEITGVPTVTGHFMFVLSVSDAASDHGSAVAHISIIRRPILTRQPRISIYPSTPTVVARGREQFSAALTETSNTAVIWSASAGTISNTGTFTAPAVSKNATVTVSAASEADRTLKATVTVNVIPAAGLAIDTVTLPEANKGTPYRETLAASGGISPYKWSLSAGALPTGVQFDSTGTITGTSANAGSFSLTTTVTDSTGNSRTKSFTLYVSSTSSTHDGPAELPRTLIQTGLANTPSPGSTITVSSGGNLQAALNNASCGETILLQAGATFSGRFVFPSKNCDDGHWIIVRTSADDSLLPPEGTRLTPCYAGVSSLPGRPPLNCSSTKNVLAKLVMNQVGTGPVIFAAGANHYRLVGLELTRLPALGVVYSLVSPVAGAPYNNIIYDRMWIHGTAQDETTRGVQLGSGTYVSVIDSTFTDFHCIAMTGSCSDAQAVAGGIGAGPMGPYKISGNFLEASGENVLFGGGAATATPTDIEVSHNYMFKPLTWMKGQPGYVGGSNGNPFIVKNLFELKNAQRVLLDGNVMENSWGGFSQVGFAILLTPKNPGASSCPVCQVTDITIRYNLISHVAAGLQIANVLSDSGAAALDGQRYSIHDIIVDDIDGSKYNGPGEFAQISVGAGSPLLQNVTMNHVTAFSPSTLFLIGDQLTNSPMKNFIFTNSIVTAGAYPMWSTGGGTTNCAYSNQPLSILKACFSPYSFANNAIVGLPSNFPSTMWPSGNYFPSTISQVEFLDFNSGQAGNYELLSNSPYNSAGTDGKPLGADTVAIQSAIAIAR